MFYFINTGNFTLREITGLHQQTQIRFDSVKLVHLGKTRRNLRDLIKTKRRFYTYYIFYYIFITYLLFYIILFLKFMFSFFDKMEHIFLATCIT